MYKNKRIVIFAAALTMLLPQIVYADSSWYWISKERPFDILPWVAAATIVIEVLLINFVPKTGHIIKTFLIVTLANFVSFMAPYLMNYVESAWYGTFDSVLDAGPTYIVDGFFVVLTVAVELPIVYNLLKRYVKSHKALMWTIVISNVITTVMVLLIERTLCYGAWA